MKFVRSVFGAYALFFSVMCCGMQADKTQPLQLTLVVQSDHIPVYQSPMQSSFDDPSYQEHVRDKFCYAIQKLVHQHILDLKDIERVVLEQQNSDLGEIKSKFTEMQKKIAEQEQEHKRIAADNIQFGNRNMELIDENQTLKRRTKIYCALFCGGGILAGWGLSWFFKK